MAVEDESLTLSELYAKYGLDHRGQKHFGRYVTVWRNVSVGNTRTAKRKSWRERRVENDLGWTIFICDENDDPVPPLSVQNSEELQADLAEAISFCKDNI